MVQLNNREIQLQRFKEDAEALEEYVKDFFEFLPLPVCVVNPLNIILGVNQSFQDFTGYNNMELGGREIVELFLERNEAILLADKIASNHGRVGQEMTILRKGGAMSYVNVYGLPRRDEDGNFIGYFLAFSDISELKKLQGSLEDKVIAKTKDLEISRRALVNILEDVDEARERAEEERNKTMAIIVNFADALLLFDQKKKVFLANPKSEEFSGLNKEALLGKSLADLAKSPFFGAIFKEIGNKLEDVFRKEIKIRENLILEATTVAITEQSNKLGVMLILHDITREKMTEKMKTEFVSLSAHQLRTPLSAIKWTLRMMLDGDLGKITNEQRDFIEKTYDSNERMISLINELLNITRIEEGRYLFDVVSCDIVEIIDSLIKIYKDDPKKGRNLEIEFIKPDFKVPNIMLDQEKIQLVIQNFLDNAIIYNRKDEKIEVTLKYNKDVKEIEISVRDHGIGIPKDQQERVFTKFFRATNAMVKDTEGSGLGLFITKNIVEAHGGKVWLESVENEGSTFFFTLPIKN